MNSKQTRRNRRKAGITRKLEAVVLMQAVLSGHMHPTNKRHWLGQSWRARARALPALQAEMKKAQKP